MAVEGTERHSAGAPRDDLLALVYDELRALAARYLRDEGHAHTLQPTALVHEAYVRLSRRRNGFQSRAHFFRAAAQAMRQVLLDHAKAKRAGKRGGDRARTALQAVSIRDTGAAPLDILALDEALERLERLEPRHVRIVELRFFAGLTNDQIAESLGCSLSTVEKDWRAARAWLHKEMAVAS